MKILLDTNVISELVAKQPNSQVLAWIDHLDSNAAYLSVVTIGELCHGIEKLPNSTRKIKLQRWLSEELPLRFYGRILNIDTDVMLAWGALVARLERAGKPMPAMDSLVAAIAIRYDCILATRNEQDFVSSGVATINPWA